MVPCLKQTPTSLYTATWTPVLCLLFVVVFQFAAKLPLLVSVVSTYWLRACVGTRKWFIFNACA